MENTVHHRFEWRSTDLQISDQESTLFREPCSSKSVVKVMNRQAEETRNEIL